MGILLERKKALSTALHTVLSIIGWPFGFFTLSKEDQVKAGINMGGEVHEIELADGKDYIDE